MRTKFGALSLAGVAIVVLVGASFPSTDLSNALALGAGVVGSRETAEIDRPLEPGTKATPVSVAGVGALPAIGRFPSFDGATGWINSPALRRDDLKGKVVLVNFWTYACGDCVSALPRITSWTEKFGKDGLVVVGVHSPEFAFEKDRSGLERAVKGYDIGYPVAIDNDYQIWRAYSNSYWPEQYVIDRQGVVRYHHLGANDYDRTQAVIEALLHAPTNAN